MSNGDSSLVLLSEPTLELLESLRESVLEGDYKRIIDEIGPALLFEDRLHCNLENKDNFQLVSSVYDIYVKSLLFEGKYAQVVEFLTNNETTNKKPVPGSNQKFIPNVIAKKLEPARIYAMYRLERYEPAKTAAATAASLETNDLDDTDQEDAKVILQHLQAQSLYHLQNYREASTIYSDLLQQEKRDYDSMEVKSLQLLNNIAASSCTHMLPCVASSWDKQQLEPHRQVLATNPWRTKHDQDDDDRICDLLYNLATHDLCTKAPSGQTSTWLRDAVKNKRNSPSEGLEPEELEKLLIPMEWNLEWSQLLWQGAVPSTSLSTATSLLSQLESKHMSVPTRLIASANQALSREDHRLLPKPNNQLFTPLQNHLLFYNRAVLHYRSSQYQLCRDVCQEWTHSMIETNPTNKSTNATHSAKQNSKKKAQQTPNQVENGITKVKLVVSSIESLFWGSRIVVLEALSLVAASTNTGAAANATAEDKNQDHGAGAVADALKSLDDQLALIQQHATKKQKRGESDDQDDILNHLILYLQTHRGMLTLQRNRGTSFSPQQNMDLLKSLPSFVQQEKAVIASLASLYQLQGKEEEAHRVLKDSGFEDALADFWIIQGRYKEVADLLELKKQNDLVSQARYVQALSYIDPERAHKEWKQLEQILLQQQPQLHEEDVSSDAVSGEHWELQELPRLKHKPRHTNMDATTVTAVTMTPGASQLKKKKSPEAVLRRRARQREQYLAEASTNRMMPSKPDPERWLPKYERSYNRSRRKTQKQSHQGGISEREAAKLDVARPMADDGKSTARMVAVSSAPRGAGKSGRRRN